MSNKFTTINNALNQKELSQIKEVLKEYNMLFDCIYRKRSAYKIIYNDSAYCLKKIRHGSKKAVKGMLLTEYLKYRGFNNTLDYIRTKDNKVFVQKKHCVYYLTKWIEGRECNFNNFDELLAAIRLMANFHMCSRGFSPEGLEIKSNIKNWPLVFKERKEDLLEFKKIIGNKKIRTNFDDNYYKYIDTFINLIDKSINLLNRSHYIEISSKAKKEKSLCHDSFYYQNILIDSKNEIYLIDMDSILYDICVYDLAKFIRRILYKKEYGWNFNAAQKMIQEYCSINPLSELEYEILLAFIIFPHKFFKLGKKRYYKKKKWNEKRYNKKLNKLIKYVNMQKEFIIEFAKYYNIENISLDKLKF